MSASRIFVAAELDGRPYRLVLDTGAPGQIMLGPSASRRSARWNDPSPFAPHRRRGLGGVGARARLVRAGGLRLGSMRFERPIVSLTDPSAAEFLEADGLLGIGVIELLNLSFDARNGRFWARRNRRPPRAEIYGFSGLWLEERRGRVEIAVLSPGSPAAAAGLREGDELFGASLAEWIRRLSGRLGEVLEIPYRRSGERLTTTLTLREFL